ncbi:hypothetical protein [Bilophila wadsworthia]|uniref:hypothetical protein n=1 Tax=Bilophila wadsworthia TaxID=35833 RepID=UPI0025974486|nr:hypothetical protein [Bilophila wadsworthia]
MSENTCPNVALSRNQNMWVVKESADKTLEFPAVTDIINVTADVFANQEIPTSDSKEKANTLNKLNVFNSSASPATANFGMYLRPTALDAPMQGDALMQALQGKLAAPFTGTLADALTDSDAQLVVTVTSGHVPLRGVIEVTSTPSGKELIRYRKAVKDAAKRLREGSEGKEVRFDAEFGSEEGRKVVVSCPRIKNKMPAINADSATVTLSQSSDILGVTLEDAVEIILE